ncbi:hypothetical protein BDD12DRAFT_803421 [Trichophaea hybrida]|nr:hypothetical protein BDD12DRAFT_803421 [Trichophaea hybrida]
MSSSLSLVYDPPESALQLELVYPSTESFDKTKRRVNRHDSILFVHGLNPMDRNNHAHMTWTHDNGILWPRDLLPNHVPEARIMLFEYNSNVGFNSSSAGIEDHAETLLARYKTFQAPVNGVRPLIFVSHSLGGIIVKQVGIFNLYILAKKLLTGMQALIKAQHNRLVYGTIKDATKGLMFFGTPHRGGNGVSFGKIAARIARCLSGSSSNNILFALEKSSVLTKQADEAFRSQLEDYQIVSFFETKKRRLFGMPLGMMVVDRESSAFGLASQRESILPVDGDHSNMCKFASDGREFRDVADCMKKLAAFALKKSLPDGKSSAHTEAFAQPTESALHDAATKLGECINTLGGVDQRFLVWNITCDTESYCRWIFVSDEYKNWEASKETILLSIFGGPGCGKTSTVANILKSYGILLPGDGASSESQMVPPPDTRPTILWFFFKGRVDGMATTFLKTIISQLIRQHSCLGECLLSLHTRNQCSLRSWESLWTILLDMLRKVPNGVMVILIVDALDECEASMLDPLCRNILRLVETFHSQREMCACPILKVLTTSRTNVSEHINTSFFNHHTIKMSAHCTAGDMESFIHFRVHQLSERKSLPLHVEIQISDFLKRHSRGMFLWVLFVLQELERRDQPLTNQALLRKLTSLPRSLSNMYSAFVEKLIDINRRDVWVTLRWVVFAKRPLHIMELQYAVCLELGISEWHDFAGDINTLFGGLVVIDKKGTVEVVHHTVREFIWATFGRATNMRYIQDFMADLSEANGLLAETCLQVLLPIMETGSPAYASGMMIPAKNCFSHCPFMRYAFSALGHHLMLASNPSQKLLALVGEFFYNTPLVDYFVLRLFVVDKQLPWFAVGCTKLHLAAYFNIGWLIDEALKSGIDPNITADMDDTPLVWASEMGSLEAIQKLLDAGADTNKQERDGWSALHWAAANGHHEVAKLLLKYGAKKDIADLRGVTPHFVASDCGHTVLAAELFPDIDPGSHEDLEIGASASGLCQNDVGEEAAGNDSEKKIPRRVQR